MPSKRCPKCGRTYAEEAQICEDCEESLMDAEELKTEGSGDIVTLTMVAGQEEAMVLANVLQAEGIPAIVEDQSLLAWTAGGTPAEAGGVRILVNSEDAEAALEILERHRRGELALSEDEDPEGSEPNQS